MRPGKRRAIPDTPDGRLQDLIETAKAHVRAKVEQPFRAPGIWMIGAGSDRKLRSKSGEAIYALRKPIIEHKFCQIKGARHLYFFLWRGLEKFNG